MLEIISEKIVFNIFFQFLIYYWIIRLFKENSISNCNEFFETNFSQLLKKLNFLEQRILQLIIIIINSSFNAIYAQIESK